MKNKLFWITFWPLWILANGLGWCLISVSFILPFWSMLVTIGFGFLISSLQWFVLKKFYDVSSNWIWLSTITYGLYMFIVLETGVNVAFLRFLIVNFLFLGFFGFLQVVLLDSCIDHSTVWVAASPVASIAGVIVAENIGSLSPGYFWAVTGVVYGFITGLTILLLENITLRHSTYPEK
jgi:hypothetical protein